MWENHILFNKWLWTMIYSCSRIICLCMYVFIYVSLLEKGMKTHSSIPVWRMPWTEEPGVFKVHGITKSQTWLSDQHFHFMYLCIFHLPILSSTYWERMTQRDKETQWETKLYLYVSPHIIVNYLRGIIDLHIKVQIMNFQKKTLNENILSSWRRKWQPTPVFLPGES